MGRLRIPAKKLNIKKITRVNGIFPPLDAKNNTMIKITSIIYTAKINSILIKRKLKKEYYSLRREEKELRDELLEA